MQAGCATSRCAMPHCVWSGSDAILAAASHPHFSAYPQTVLGPQISHRAHFYRLFSLPARRHRSIVRQPPLFPRQMACCAPLFSSSGRDGIVWRNMLCNGVSWLNGAALPFRRSLKMLLPSARENDHFPRCGFGRSWTTSTRAWAQKVCSPHPCSMSVDWHFWHVGSCCWHLRWRRLQIAWPLL